MARWASWMVLVALFGCTTNALAQSPPVQRAPPVVPEMPQDTWREAPPPDMRFANRRFARAFDNFAIAVRRLATSPTPPTDRDMAYTLELFARALESSPYARTVRASRAAADMRAAVRDASLAGPPGSPAARQLLGDALIIGTDVLLDLAYGPYSESPEVSSWAWRLESILYGSENDSPRTFGQSFDQSFDPRFTVVLGHSVVVMRAMLEAGGAPPPPRPPPPPRYE